MATTAAGTTLTRKHQQEHTRTGALFYALALRMWAQYVRQDDLDASAQRWMNLLIPRALEGRKDAARRSRQYYQAFRILETPERTIWRPPNDVVSLERQVIETSLRVTGPVAFKQKVAKISQLDLDPDVAKALTEQAMKEAGEQAAAAVLRHVVDGGRQQVVADSKADQLALGFMRVTRSGNPCFFCAILASRGPVYGEESFETANAGFIGVGTDKAHDHCACAMEPVFDRSTAWPETSQRAAQVWGDVTAAGYSGNGAINAFRKIWEGR